MKSKFIILIIFCVNIGFAQYPVLTTTSLAGNPNLDPKFNTHGNYARDINNEREQYVGLWRYNQNDILFELKIEKRDMFITKYENQGNVFSYDYCDEIIFKYRLVKNGIEIYNNLAANIPEGYLSSASKFGNYDFASGLFVDATHNVRANVSVKRISTSPDKIFFNLSSGSYYYLNPRSYYETIDVIFTIPLDGIEMVRVN
jgi:hypothetical protein